MKLKITVLCISVLAIALSAGLRIAQAQATSKADAVAAVTKIEGDSVKADLTNDKAFFAKVLAEDWTGGDSGGKWFTKADVLKMMDDTKNNKTNSEKMSELKVRVYGNTAVATYKDTYDALMSGEHRSRTVISTDTFVKIAGEWKMVSGHTSEAK